jgi:ribosomal protein S18 acetylase RimI-like enzyme
VPAVNVTITYLEMEHPSMLRPRRVARDGVTLERVHPPTPDVAARFYREVGAPWHWVDRLQWTDAQWSGELTRDGTELWVLRVDGKDAGFFQLLMPRPGVSEIHYFGLLPGLEGQGLGAHLLTLAVERGWDMGAEKVILNTCTLDHPSALPNYLARGFEIVGTHTERRELPEHA